MEDIGRNTKVRLNNGEIVEGWVYAETSQAFYVALDINGENIRLILRGKYQSISFSDENISEVIKARCPEPKAIYDLEELLNKPLKTALSKIDQNRISRIGQKFNAVQLELMYYERMHYIDKQALILVVNAFDANKELLEELSTSKIDKLILKHAEAIQKVISPTIIPLIDGYTHLLDIDQLIHLAKEQNLISETNLGRLYSDKIKSDDILELDEEQEKTKEDNHPRRIRKISAGLKIASGGLLTVANITIGSLVGIVSALPTLAIGGAVSPSVSIATSIHTGINTICDGLKDLAAAKEGK
ncbi:MAG: hypothetical protein HOO91_21525 [Bacteroidales bacterium]|nr:hypothetical protein [Bacteroidales bacterium]